MGFIRNDIRECDYYAVETTEGRKIVPATYVRSNPSVDALRPHVSGTILRSYQVERKSGFIARQHEEGQLYCTDWSGHASVKEAEEYLELHGVCDETEPAIFDATPREIK